MAQTNWRTPTNFNDWKEWVEKRLANQERRFNPRVASDIMGPVLGPYAVKVLDWNADEAQFDGIIYSEPIALNAPEDGKYFMGWTNGMAAGFGLQWATEYRVENTWVPVLWVRRFWDIGDGGTRMFSEWVKVNEDERDDESDPMWEPVLPTGFTAEAWPGGIRCTWDGSLDGGARVIVPGFRNLEIVVT